MTSFPPAAYVHSEEPGSAARRFAELLRALVVRELKGRYRRSLLGPLWAVLQPLTYMALFVALRRMLGLASAATSDVIVLYSAMVPWTFFSGAVAHAAGSVLSNAPLVKKMAVAREVFPAAAVAVALVDFLIASLVLVGMMLWYRVPVGGSLLWLAVLAPLLSLLALGLGLGAVALGTLKQDVSFAVPFLMQFWLFATPILYPLERVPEAWRGVYVLNPMVGLIQGFQRVLTEGRAPDPALLGISAGMTLVVWALAWPLFRHLSQYFADVL
ncbi:MAG: ABC transporter permease [Planctomycetota bacterium]